MPRKFDQEGSSKTKQIGVTLPAGTRYMLDQLVALRVLGDGHSEVIRNLVAAQIDSVREKYGLKLPVLVKAPSAANYDPSFAADDSDG